MKKVFKKILVCILIVSIMSGPYNYKNEVYASSGEGAIIGLELILMMLLSYVANQYDVNLPIPENDIDKFELYKKAFTRDGIFDIDAVDKYELYNINTEQTYMEWYLAGGSFWDINMNEWITLQEEMRIEKQDLDKIRDGVLEYYDVPEFTTSIDTSINHNIINVMSALNKNNILISETAINNSGITNFKYILIVKMVSENVLNTETLILGSDSIMYLADKYVTYNNQEMDCVVFNPNVIEKNDLMVISLNYNNSSNIWYLTDKLNSNVQVYDISPINNITNLDDRILFNNFDLIWVKPTWSNSFSNYHDGYTRDSDLSYRTFLKSKYGGGALGLEDGDTVNVKLGVLGKVIRHEPELYIDDFGNTDTVLENLKNIDDFAQENYGERVISPTITDVKPIVYPIEYTEIMEITDSIDSNFNNALGSLDFTTTDFPEYLLVGLSFVAWVFGQMWTSMGDYSIVLIFSASVAIVAMLFGLGLKREKTRDKSESDTKSSKTKKK